jgi:hypothetical protein
MASDHVLLVVMSMGIVAAAVLISRWLSGGLSTTIDTTNKYRIITNGKVFRVQRRRYGCLWVSLRVAYMVSAWSYSTTPRDFKTRAEAEMFVEAKVRNERAHQKDRRRRWRVVEGAEMSGFPEGFEQRLGFCGLSWAWWRRLLWGNE